MTLRRNVDLIAIAFLLAMHLTGTFANHLRVSYVPGDLRPRIMDIRNEVRHNLRESIREAVREALREATAPFRERRMY